MSEPVTYLGAKLRQLAAEHGSGVTQLGTLFVRVTCHGNEWACELNDDKPVFPWQAQEWGKAVGVPEGTEWRHTAQLMVARCEWTGTEEPAAAGTQAFYLWCSRDPPLHVPRLVPNAVPVVPSGVQRAGVSGLRLQVAAKRH